MFRIYSECFGWPESGHLEIMESELESYFLKIQESDDSDPDFTALIETHIKTKSQKKKKVKIRFRNSTIIK